MSLQNVPKIATKLITPPSSSNAWLFVEKCATAGTFLLMVLACWKLVWHSVLRWKDVERAEEVYKRYNRGYVKHHEETVKRLRQEQRAHNRTLTTLQQVHDKYKKRVDDLALKDDELEQAAKQYETLKERSDYLENRLHKVEVGVYAAMSPDSERDRRVTFSPELPEESQDLRKKMNPFKQDLQEKHKVTLVTTCTIPRREGANSKKHRNSKEFIELLAKELTEVTGLPYDSDDLWRDFLEFAGNH
jgi:myosin heavy subunit